jgi:hypothetical protein
MRYLLLLVLLTSCASYKPEPIAEDDTRMYELGTFGVRN